MAERDGVPDSENNPGEIRGKLIKRLAVAGALVASLLGVITGVFGGVLRDIFCNQVPLTFLPNELYATAAWVGALTLIGLQSMGVDAALAAWIGMATVFLVRSAAIRFRIKLPSFQSKPDV